MAQTMFGDVFSARQTGMEDLEKSAATLAALQPGRGSVYAAGMAGGMLGRGLGQAFGAHTPAEAKQAKMAEIQAQFEGLRMDDPENMRKVQSAFWQAGLYDEANKVADMISTAESDITSRLTALKTSRAEKGTMEKYMDTAAKMVENPDGTLGCDWTTDAACKRKAETIAARFKRAGELEKYGGKYAQIVAEGDAETDLALIENAPKAVEAIQKTNQVLDLLDKGEAHTGMFANFKTNISRILAMAGSDVAKGEATDTQLLEALLGSDVFPMIGQLGIGARGLDTPAEREFLLKVMTGTVEMEPDAIRKLTEIRQNISKRIVERFNEKVEAGGFADYERVTGRAISRINLEAFERKKPSIPKVSSSEKPAPAPLPKSRYSVEIVE